MLTKNKIIKKIGQGKDSFVYLLKGNKVLKDYEILIAHQKNMLSFEGICSAIEEYGQDTESVKEFLLKKRVDNKLTIQKDEYKLNVIIVSQGEVDINKEEEKIYSIGQEYIFGRTLEELSYMGIKENLIDSNSSLDLNSDDVFNLESKVKNIEENINGELMKLGLRLIFKIDNRNVIPRIDLKNKIVHFYITDLCASISSTYLS